MFAQPELAVLASYLSPESFHGWQSCGLAPQTHLGPDSVAKAAFTFVDGKRRAAGRVGEGEHFH